MILDKNNLKINRSTNIYTNDNNEVTAAKVATFCDNFIDSIYAYSDTKWSNLQTYESYKIGVSGYSHIDFQENDINFVGSSASIKLNNYRHIDFYSNDNSITIRDNVLIDDDGVYVSGGYIKGKFKSYDDSIGTSFSEMIYGALNDTILEVESGIVIKYMQTGYTMQVDVFNLDGDPDLAISGATIKVNNILSLTTNSIGRATFLGRLNQEYSLRIDAPGAYDPTTYTMTCTGDPTIKIVILPYTG